MNINDKKKLEENINNSFEMSQKKQPNTSKANIKSIGQDSQK